MRTYYIVDCITGSKEGAEPFHTIEEARKVRDEWNAKRKAEGGSDDFWMIIDRNGKEIP